MVLLFPGSLALRYAWEFRDTLAIIILFRSSGVESPVEKKNRGLVVSSFQALHEANILRVDWSVLTAFEC